MFDFEKRPKIEEVEALRDHLLGVWQNSHTKWNLADDYYFRRFALWKPEQGRPEYHPARSTSVVDHAVDNQLAYDPHVHRYPAGKGLGHDVRADRIEPFLKAVLDDAVLMEPVPTWKQVGKHLLLYGYAVVEGPVLDLRERPTEPEREEGESDKEYRQRMVVYQNERKTWFPFRLRAVHPARVLLDPSEKNPLFGIKHSSRYSIDLQRITTKRLGKRRAVQIWGESDNPYELVLCDEFWSKQWHMLSVEGKVLFVEKNAWQFVPYAHAFAGFGQEPTDTNTVDPQYLAVGILDPIMESLLAQAQQAAGRHNAVIEATFNRRVTTGDAAAIAEQEAAGSNIIEIEGQNSLRWMEIPQLPQWMFESERWIDADIELGSYSRSVAGIRETGVSTVGQQAILSTAAGRKFIAPAKQMEHLATVTARNVLRLVDIIGESMTARGYTISPSDIEHDYSVQVTFELVDPVLQLQERQQGMREVEMGLKSPETYWSADARLEDATGERRRILRSRVWNSPIVQEILAKEVLRQEGLEQMLQLLEIEDRAIGHPSAEGPAGNGLRPEVAPELYGPDGMPLSMSMGQTALSGNPAGTPERLGQRLRQPLTPQVPKPGRIIQPGQVR